MRAVAGIDGGSDSGAKCRILFLANALLPAGQAFVINVHAFLLLA
jgi:hypothetical protein